jgi:hypothetical protein
MREMTRVYPPPRQKVCKVFEGGTLGLDFVRRLVRLGCDSGRFEGGFCQVV